MSYTPYRLPVVSRIKSESLINMLKRGLRSDQRDLLSPRNITIEVGVIEKANGSALVKLGKTQVLVGIKVEPGRPFPDTPDEGVLQVNSELVPMASPVFEPGPPDENAIELARVIDRSLRDPKAIDLKSLVIRPGEKAWVLWIDVYVLDYDGNYFDASMLGVMAALMNTKLPEYEETESGELIVHRDKLTTPLKLNKRVVLVTTAKIGDYIVVDPNLDEELIADARLTLAFDEEGNVVGAQKSSIGGYTRSELSRAIEVSRKASQIYFKLLDQALQLGKQAG
ncbi:MAG: exosome complex protein Rrp42 [Acidilobus sp.]|nr:exosome complex protein Rrp42 [Acidilobus sp.]MCG2889312.1 exosome complex protein Rrp42 [Acidilobus sp.]MCG2890706.1 exosome complex protein Rrp42 [Acidilobus sp.]